MNNEWDFCSCGQLRNYKIMKLLSLSFVMLPEYQVATLSDASAIPASSQKLQEQQSKMTNRLNQVIITIHCFKFITHTILVLGLLLPFVHQTHG